MKWLIILSLVMSIVMLISMGKIKVVNEKKCTIFKGCETKIGLLWIDK